MTKIESKIMFLLANEPYRDFFNQEIASQVRCNKGTASLILRRLLRNKLISMVSRGNMNFYQINQANQEVKRWKIDVVITKIKSVTSALERIADQIILFGSASRGEQTVDSDIDLFVMTRQKAEVAAIIKKKKTFRLIKPIIKTSTEWSEMEVVDPEFYQEIKNGIKLH